MSAREPASDFPAAVMLGAIAVMGLMAIGAFLDRAPDARLLLRAPIEGSAVEASAAFSVWRDPTTLALELEARRPVAVAFVHEDTGETIQLRLAPGRVLVDRIPAGRYVLRLAPSAEEDGLLYVTEGVRSANGFSLAAALLGLPLLGLLWAPRRRFLGPFAVWAVVSLAGYAGYCATAMDVSATTTERRTVPPGSARAAGGFEVEDRSFWIQP